MYNMCYVVFFKKGSQFSVKSKNTMVFKNNWTLKYENYCNKIKVLHLA